MKLCDAFVDGLLTLRSSSTPFLPFPSNSQTFTGDFTYYSPGLGACGQTSGDGDDIVSVSRELFDSQINGENPSDNPLCGLKIRAQRFNQQVGAMRSVDLTVVDRCIGCKPVDLDVSRGAFEQLADMDLGRVKVTWAWLTAPPK